MTDAFTRRCFLKSSLGAVATMSVAPIATAASQSGRFMIVNADDLGLSSEIDRGIFEAHDGGIVTSASVLMDAPDVGSAVEEARKRPKLGLGIHVAFDSRGKWTIDVQDLDAVQREIDRQLEVFARLTGGPPDHIDSHHHVHLRFNVARFFLDAGRQHGVPVRGFSDVVYIGRFYGQPEFGKTDMSRVSVEAMLGLLQSLRPGVSEIACHPGHVETRPDAIYNRERETELSTLTDERLKTAIADEGIQLINYRDYARLRSG
jgi:chitin disaccharide deacetylase